MQRCNFSFQGKRRDCKCCQASWWRQWCEANSRGEERVSSFGAADPDWGHLRSCRGQ